MSIICHEHQFIFIKTRKTGSTSVQVALSKLCGVGDTVTPISISTEMKDRGEEIPYVRGRSHSYPDQIQKMFPSEWRAYTKIVVIRHPYTQVPSLVTHSRKKEPIIETRKRIREFAKKGHLDMENFVYGPPTIAAGKFLIMKFESLEDDFNYLISNILDVGRFISLPKLRVRKNPVAWEELLTPKLKHLIQQKHERLFSTFYSPKTVWAPTNLH